MAPAGAVDALAVVDANVGLGVLGTTLGAVLGEATTSEALADGRTGVGLAVADAVVGATVGGEAAEPEAPHPPIAIETAMRRPRRRRVIMVRPP